MDDESASFRRVDRSDAVCLVVEGEIDLVNISESHRAASMLIDDASSPAVRNVLEVVGLQEFFDLRD